MKRLLCWLTGGHKRAKTKHYRGYWGVQCGKCGYWFYYKSGFARLVGVEMAHGFDGE